MRPKRKYPKASSSTLAQAVEAGLGLSKLRLGRGHIFGARPSDYLSKFGFSNEEVCPRLCQQVRERTCVHSHE